MSCIQTSIFKGSSGAPFPPDHLKTEEGQGEGMSGSVLVSYGHGSNPPPFGRHCERCRSAYLWLNRVESSIPEQLADSRPRSGGRKLEIDASGRWAAVYAR